VVSLGSTRPGKRRDFHRKPPHRNSLRTSKMQVERIWEFLRRLTPSTKNCLLTELERLEICGIDMPCSADIQARLRAELRKDGPTQSTATPFPLLFSRAVGSPCSSTATPSMKIRGGSHAVSLAPIWEWIGRDLLPIMARDYK